MIALRRVTRADLQDSTLVHQFALQAHMAHLAGEIPTEIRDGIICVAARVHTGIAARSGVLARQRQRRYDLRNKKLFNGNILDLFIAGSLLAMVAAWIWLI